MSDASQEKATSAVQAVQHLVKGLQDGESSEAVRDCFRRLRREVQGWTATGADEEAIKLGTVSFLRGASEAAACLSRYSLPPSQPSPGDSSGRGTQWGALPPLTTLEWARLACFAAELLLHITGVSLHFGCQLESSVIFRLTSCARVALGPATKAAQLAYSYATADSHGEPQASLAATLNSICITIFSTAGDAVFITTLLEGRDPAPVLKTVICSPRRTSVLCHQLAPILVWCSEQQGEPPSALGSLSELLARHAELSGTAPILREGPSGLALATLATSHYANLCRGVLRQNHGWGAEAEAGGRTHAARALSEETLSAPAPTPAPAEGAEGASAAGAMLECELDRVQEHAYASIFIGNVGPWLCTRNALPAVLPATAATVALLRMMSAAEVDCPAVELAVRALADLASAALDSTGPTMSPSQRQQQEHAGNPTVCLEAAAVSCSALIAVLEFRMSPVPNPLTAAVEASDTLPVLCGAFLALTHLLGQAVLPRIPRTPPRSQVHPGISFIEAALRLAGCLAWHYPRMGRLPGAEQAGLAEAVPGLCNVLLMAPGCLVPCLARTLLGGQPGDCAYLSCMPVSDRAVLARRVSSLAASAAKVAAVQKVATERGHGQLVSDGLWMVHLIKFAWDVVASMGSAGEGIWNRHLLALVLTAVPSYTQLELAYPSMGRQCERSQFSTLYPGFVKLIDLAELLARLDSLPVHVWGLGLQMRLVVVMTLLWRVMMGHVDRDSHIWPGMLLEIGEAAAGIAERVHRWQKSALLAVELGFLEVVVGWVLLAAQKAEQHTPLGSKCLQAAWRLVASLAERVLVQEPTRADAEGAAKDARKVLHDMEQLSPARQRKELASKKFWSVDVQQRLLPALQVLERAAAAAARMPTEGKHASFLLQASRALATRVCANPDCPNLRGCCEERLRGRRCSGCGVVKYCTPQCQVTDFAQHGQVCQLLKEERPDGQVD